MDEVTHRDEDVEAFVVTLNSWVGHLGKNEAGIRLLRRGMTPSTVARMVSGLYRKRPQAITLAALIEEFAREGFTIGQARSSTEMVG